MKFLPSVQEKEEFLGQTMTPKKWVRPGIVQTSKISGRSFKKKQESSFVKNIKMSEKLNFKKIF